MIDTELEALIDKAGRQRVFNFVTVNGWNYAPPAWVWRAACHEVMAATRKDNGGR